MRRIGTVPVVVAVLGAVLAGVLGVGAGAWAGGAAGRDQPDPRTIVRVTGDAADGFGIRRLDGSETFPPTDSEARAECGEHDRRWRRVRCRTEVRTWYRDLGELQRSLRWARSRR